MENGVPTDEELERLTTLVMDQHGYDFSNYSKASLKRRVAHIYMLDRHSSFEALLHHVLTDKDYLARFIEKVTVNVTEMFRDPHFYKTLRTEILPVLATHPLIKIWHAGCATGEEVYSVAIMLEEANLLHKSRLYATDINPSVLAKAGSAMFPLSFMKQYSENYIHSGGTRDFSSYYTARYGSALFDKKLRERMVFATHNLVSDRSFNEFQLIICRNVLIYFDKVLQDKVLHLFDDSLEMLGYLALGSKETLRFSGVGKKYRQMVQGERIWRKML